MDKLQLPHESNPTRAEGEITSRAVGQPTFHLRPKNLRAIRGAIHMPNQVMLHLVVQS
jgi:hypothetical protein